MATEDDKKDTPSEPTEVVEAPTETSVLEPTGEDAPVSMGAARYVHAAFFLAAILGAYVLSKMLVMAWGFLAEWPAAIRAVPQLVAYDEDQREGITLVIGAAIGTVAVIQTYRKERIRGWADGVASELTKVTWPTRETVMNGTIVVVVASAVATLYVAILDRFWGFLTTLVYGA